MKASKYSNTYQMHEQRGSFQGIDTCNVTTLADFAHESHLLRQFENLYVAQRPDIVSLLSELVKKKKMSKLLKESIIDLAYTHQLSEERLASYLHGSTYVSLEDAMVMQGILCDANSKKVRVVKISEDEETIGTYSTHFV